MSDDPAVAHRLGEELPPLETLKFRRSKNHVEKSPLQMDGRGGFCDSTITTKSKWQACSASRVSPALQRDSACPSVAAPV